MTARVRSFQWPVRVYYEDTDAGGVVFYANYLSFMERARTEWLRALGFSNSRLAQKRGLLFAVARLQVDYLKPARLDDELVVTARLAEARQASLVFEQDVLRADEILCRGIIKLVCVDSERFRPTAIPREIRDSIDDEQ